MSADEQGGRDRIRRRVTWTLALLALLLLGNFLYNFGRYHYALYQAYKLTGEYYGVEGGFMDFKHSYEQTRRQISGHRGGDAPPLVRDLYNRMFYLPDVVHSDLGFKAGKLKSTPTPGVTRVLCVGPSTTERGYPGPLARLLQEQHPGRFEIINAGISGSLLLNTLNNYMLTWRQLKPDVVIIEDNINDVGFNHVPFSISRMSKEDFRSDTGEFDLNHMRPPSGSIWRLFRFGAHREAVERAKRPHPDGLARYRTLLENLVLMVKATGARPLLLTYQSALSTADLKGKYGPEFLNEAIGFYRGLYFSFTVKGALRCIEEHNRILREIAAKHRCGLVDTVGRIPRKEENFLDGNHHADRANRLVARLVARRLVSARGEPDAPSRETPGDEEQPVAPASPPPAPPPGQ